MKIKSMSYRWITALFICIGIAPLMSYAEVITFTTKLDGAAFASVTHNDAPADDYSFVDSTYARGVVLNKGWDWGSPLGEYIFILPPSSAGTYGTITLAIRGKGSGVLTPKVYVGANKTEISFLERQEGAYSTTVSSSHIEQQGSYGVFRVYIQAASYCNYDVDFVQLTHSINTQNKWLRQAMFARSFAEQLRAQAAAIDHFDFERNLLANVEQEIAKALDFSGLMVGYALEATGLGLLAAMLDGIGALSDLESLRSTLSGQLDLFFASLTYDSQQWHKSPPAVATRFREDAAIIETVSQLWLSAGADGNLSIAEQNDIASAASSLKNRLTGSVNSTRAVYIQGYLIGWRAVENQHGGKINQWAHAAVDALRPLVSATIGNGAHEVFPNKSALHHFSDAIDEEFIEVQIRPSPSHLTLKINGQDYAGGGTFRWIKGTTHTIEAPESQDGYVFTSWSDGGARVRSITPTQSGSYTASYRGGITREASADTFVVDNTPNHYYGTADYASVRTAVGGRTEHALMKFTLADIPHGSAIHNVELRFMAGSVGGTGAGYSLLRFHKATSAWSETTTWNTKPSYVTSSAFNYYLIESSTYELCLVTSIAKPELLTLVTDWVNNPSGNHGFYITCDHDAALIQTREVETPENRPRLFVEFTPAPPGSLSVTINPEDARTQGGRWRLTSGPDNDWKNSGALISGLPTGYYRLEFESLPGWRRPTAHNDDILIASGNNYRTDSYRFDLSAPSGVSATDGTYNDRIRVTWNSSDGATGYEVWQSSSLVSSTATKIADVTGTAYNDTDTSLGSEYYYWITAKNSAGTTGFSTMASGFRGFRFIQHPVSQVAGDDGRAVLSVAVEGSGPFDYQWYRGTQALPGQDEPTLVVENFGIGDDAIYYCVVNAPAGTQRSDMARISKDALFAGVIGGDPVPDDLSQVIAVAAGSVHNLAMRADGRVMAWGTGIPWLEDFGQSRVPDGLSDVVAIAAGYSYSLALKSDGTVVAWGDNWAGQSTVPDGLSDVVAIAAGGNHSLALKSDGTVVAWGDDSFGKATVPDGLSDVVAIAAGYSHSLALKSDGTVVAWGSDQHWSGEHLGQSSVPDGLSDVIAIAAGFFHSLALKSDGTVVAWGDDDLGQSTVPDGLSDVVAIAAGGYHNLALKSDGTIVTWGVMNIWGNLPQERLPDGLSDVVAIAAGYSHILFVAAPQVHVTAQPVARTFGKGTPIHLGLGVLSMPTPHTVDWFKDDELLPGDGSAQLIIPDATLADEGVYWASVSNGLASTESERVQIRIMSITTEVIPAGMEMTPFNMQMQASGGVAPYTWSTMPVLVAWGSNWNGQSTVPDGLSDVAAIAAGMIHSMALKSDGTVVAWGANWGGQCDVPPGLNDVVAIAAGGTHSLALKSDGTVVAWGADWFFESTVPDGLSDVVGIAAGWLYSLALKSDGTVITWGDDWWIPEPGDVTDVVAIAAGRYHAMMLQSDGTVVAFANPDPRDSDYYGQSSVPDGLADVVAIAAGGSHSLALKSDGTVVAWGNDASGQSTVPDGLSDVVAIAAGWRYSLALKSDGTVVAWGSSPHSHSAVIAGLTDVLAIAAGAYHGLALRSADTQLPQGLTVSPDGIIQGTPVLAGTTLVTFVAEDIDGGRTHNRLEIVIEPNPNTRPAVDSTEPEEGMVSMDEKGIQAFSVTAHDPEGEPLTYHWMLNGEPVGDGTANYTFTTDWGDAGFYDLRCYVSDDLWDQIVYAQWSITVPVPPPSTLTGRVRGSGVPLEGAYVELRRVDGSVYRRVYTDAAGNYVLDEVRSGYYRMKAGADFYADVWYQNVSHLDQADLLTVPAESVIGGLDFDLVSGQSPALVEVTSDPVGADIYLDYWPTGEVTPAVINVGEIGDWDWAGYRLAPHVITLKKVGHPRPSPQTVPAVEAVTVAVLFDLTSSATGAVSVVTTPEGAEVYVDYADAAEGVTPIVVGNLAPGSHTILLRKTGYLQPRPITAWVLENEMTEVVIPLELDTAESRMMAEVQSVPQGIPIYVDYLPSGQVTDALVGLMDPALHEGTGWHSALHTILLRREGALPMAPRYVPDVANSMHWMLIHLRVDPDGAMDSNGDGVPDWLWAQYGYTDPFDVPDVNAIADTSGMTYGDKLRAGLIPGDPNSRFEMGAVEIAGDPETGLTITFVFDTVPGRRYVVQAREKLTEGGWTNISSVITATAYQTVFTGQMLDDTRNQFYRLIVLAP